MAFSASAFAVEGEYQKPTAATNIIDYYGYHDDQFFAGVTWDVYSTATKYRDQVYAPLNGKILKIAENDALGKFIIIEHNDELRTLLAGLDKVDVTEGQDVAQGSVVATTLTDKPLYQEITYLGTPIDPASVIGFKAEDFQYFYTEAVDEIERGPYLLISDLDFSQWDQGKEMSLAAQSAANAAQDIAEGNSMVCDPRNAGETTFAGSDDVYYCCELKALTTGDQPIEYAGRYVKKNECDCDILNNMTHIALVKDRITEKLIRAANHNQAPTSIMDLICWDQWSAMEGQIGDTYQPPKTIGGIIKESVQSVVGGIGDSFNSLIQNTTVPLADAWRKSYYGASAGQGGDILNLPGLAVLSYMRAQEFLDRAVDIINDGVRQLAGAVLNGITGGIFSGFLPIFKEFECDVMRRLWNVAEDCYDLKIPEIPDLLGRIKLPGLNCELEAFAYGGTGLSNVSDLVYSYSPYGPNWDPYVGVPFFSPRASELSDPYTIQFGQ